MSSLGVGTIGTTGGQVVGAVCPAIGVVEIVHASHVNHVGGGKGQGVGGGVAGQVNDFNAVDAAQTIGRGPACVFDGGQVQVAPALGDAQGVGPCATQDPGQLYGVATCTEHILQSGEVAGVEHKDIVARAAHHHIRTAATRQGVVTHPSGKGFSGCGAGLRLGTAGAHEVHSVVDKGSRGAAKNHIALAC